MKEKTRYTDEPMKVGRILPDFLPPAGAAHLQGRLGEGHHHPEFPKRSVLQGGGGHTWSIVKPRFGSAQELFAGGEKGRQGKGRGAAAKKVRKAA